MPKQIRNEFLTLSVSSIGAELYALHTPDGPEPGFLWNGDESAWDRRAPVCFPWCGRLENGGFEEGGHRFEGGVHGFIRDLEHRLMDSGKDFLTYRVDWSADERIWPYSFSFTTTHRLEGSTVVTTCTATNRDKKPMPMQQGFHTALRCPMTPGKTTADYILRFEQEEHGRLVLFEGGFITGETVPVYTGQSVVPLEPHMFDTDSICLENLRSRWIRLEEKDTGRYLQMEIGGFRNVVLWSQPGIPGFFCIEPWNGLPARVPTIADRPMARILAPGESFSATQRLTVQY
ncbi:MAG: hypothetical protein RR216_01600 [Pseudoflavonifractor sp.]